MMNELNVALKEFETDKEPGTFLGKRIFKQYTPHPMAYLSMRTEIPHALATYHPLIEDEFVMRKASAWRKEMKGTDKVIKRKEKKYEKEQIRELKKDTQAIQD